MAGVREGRAGARARRRAALPLLPARTLDSFVDEEFVCGGRAIEVEDEEVRASVVAAHTDSVGPEHRLFLLELDRAFLKLRRGGTRTHQAWLDSDHADA